VTRLLLATTNTEFEERVRRAFDGQLNGDLRYWRDGMLRGDPARAVRELIRGKADVVALGPGLPADTALELARAFDHEFPDVSVVIVAEPSASMLRAALHAGARDVISPQADEGELRVAFERILTAAGRRRSALDVRAEGVAPTTRVVTVLCPKGGAGKTTVASNLAVGLAREAPGQVAILDLDLQFGDVASALRLTPEHTFSDAARSTKALDTTALKVFLTHHPKELFALCAPDSPVDVDDFTAEHVEAVLSLLIDSFRYVVVDTASGLDEAALVALEHSTDLVVLCSTDVPTVRSTQKEVQALRVIGNPTQRWHFVLNRSDARTGLGRGEVETTVGLPVDVAIPESRALPVSLNQGTPIIDFDPRAPAAQALSQLVDRVRTNGDPGLARPQPEASSSGFWRRRAS
jgi:pilus assembly protein CpaE